MEVHSDVRRETHKVGHITTVAITACNDASINTSGIACNTIRTFARRSQRRKHTMPEVHENVGDGLAGISVDQLNINVYRYTRLLVANIPPNELAIDI